MRIIPYDELGYDNRYAGREVENKMLFIKIKKIITILKF